MKSNIGLLTVMLSLGGLPADWLMILVFTCLFGMLTGIILEIAGEVEIGGKIFAGSLLSAMVLFAIALISGFFMLLMEAI